MGLTLKNPIIIGSSGLTDKPEKIKDLETKGAGAVVLKSIFEEEIMAEAEHKIKSAEQDKYMYSQFSETFDYIDMHVKSKRIEEYIDLIKEAKNQVMIPVIASINCISSHEWTSFAKTIQDAGADALELNVFILPSDVTRKGEENEKLYFDIIEKVKKEISIPLSLKISPYFSGLANMVSRLSVSGVNGITFFNRFYSPDINIETMEVTAANVFSQPNEIYNTLRWVSLLSGKIKCDIAASTGISSGEDVIKQLLAGASAVQIASVVYNKGSEVISEMLNEIENWMERKKFNYIAQFKGKLSQENSDHPAAFERIQFMKYFSGIN
ncbi:MAG: dihydroorotate dehydrogenase-like protein [Marinilabiliales bacterium]